MFETLKQTVFASVGLASLTKEKVEGVMAEVARRAKLSEAEANELQKDVAERVEKARQELGVEIDRRIDQAFIQLGILKAGVKHGTESAASAVRRAIDQTSDAAFQQLALARTEDIEALTKRVELLEKKLAATH
jgi:polyhydroxyalkanoate synthesis regulator phasin